MNQTERENTLSGEDVLVGFEIDLKVMKRKS
jgi:hypothetical protein